MRKANGYGVSFGGDETMMIAAQPPEIYSGKLEPVAVLRLLKLKF